MNPSTSIPFSLPHNNKSEYLASCGGGDDEDNVLSENVRMVLLCVGEAIGNNDGN